MKRLIFQQLKKWVSSALRKPLLLRGARQVGKTHVVRQLGATFKYFVEANFERVKELQLVFKDNLDPKQICEKLELIFNQKIVPKETLVFFDEIQVCPEAIIALRYFYEEMPDLHVIAASSLLDFAIEKVGVPVGRVSFCYMYPMSFIEFLLATGHELFAGSLLNHTSNEPMNELLHQKGLKLLGEYMLVGGMPEAVQHWAEKRDISICGEIHRMIVDTYRDDFDKYAKKSQLKYTELLYDRIPGMVCENFKFSHVSKDYQKRELSPCLDLLIKARVVQKIIYSACNGIPLGAESDSDKFKLIFLDVALTQTMLGLEVKDWILQPEQAFHYVNKGKLAEALVGQELLAYGEVSTRPLLYYWHRSTAGSVAEVDYVISLQQDIIPIEVKSGKGSTLRSMHAFLQSKEKTTQGWRFSVQNYSTYERIRSFPLYAVASALNEAMPGTIIL